MSSLRKFFCSKLTEAKFFFGPTDTRNSLAGNFDHAHQLFEGETLSYKLSFMFPIRITRISVDILS